MRLPRPSSSLFALAIPHIGNFKKRSPQKIAHRTDFLLQLHSSASSIRAALQGVGLRFLALVPQLDSSIRYD